MSRSQDQRDKGFRAALKEAVAATIGVAPSTVFNDHEYDLIAAKLLDLLHERGLAIHDPEHCIRARTWQQRQAMDELRQQVGREMTVDEQIMFGLLVVSDALPDES